MSRLRIVLPVVFAALAAMACLLLLRPEPAPPPGPVAPHAAPPTTTAPLLAGTGPQLATSGTGSTGTNASDERVPSQPAVDPRDATVAVRVLVGGEHDERPAAHVEVALLVADDDRTHAATRSTDAAGNAEFVVQGGHGRLAQVVTAIGANATVPMAGGQTATVTLRARPRAIVEGRVVDAGGQGIGGADLLLLPWTDPTANPPRPWRVGRTAADGSFLLTLAAGGRLGALHADYAASPMHLVRAAAAGAAPVRCDLVLTLLAAARSLRGTVVDATGAPVAAAELQFRSLGQAAAGAELPAAPRRLRSDASGAFVVDNLAAGPIEFAARAQGHGRTRGAVTIPAGAAADLIVRLPPPSNLAGTVPTAAGEPVAGVLVTAGEPGAFDSATVPTRADGSYLLVDLAPGPTELRASLPNRSRPLATTTLVLAAGTTNTWHPVLAVGKPTPELRGEVVDHNGSPLAGWTVEMRTRPRQRADTDAEGRFAFPQPPGPVDLRVFAPQGDRTGFAAAVRREVPPADPVRISIDPRQRRAELRGRVTNLSQETIAADIECWHVERAEWVTFRTADDGSFVVRGVPDGTLDVTVRATGHVPVTRPGLTIAGGQDLDLGIVVLGAAGMLAGRVIGPDGLPPTTCELFLVHGDDRYDAEYSAGAYRFPAVPPGLLTLHVQGQQFAAATFPVTIRANVEQVRDVELRAGVARRFCVAAPPAAGPRLSLALRQAGQDLVWTADVLRGDHGEAVFLASMAPGQYEAVAWGRAGYESRTTVVFQAGDEAEVRLELRPK
ncbi:MAG: carboxypeptidase regulatory-like domain-containing protein [Planctomycetes bacterium]|nr:carboxypeptidase regulatory-like domain-containing protein [Planctomycetota bacterium]